MRAKSVASAGRKGRKCILGVAISIGLTACHCSGVNTIWRASTKASRAQLLIATTPTRRENPKLCNSAAERVLPIM
jgi:hypothetical protein